MADTFICGGRGDMSGADNTNGGGFVQGGDATYTTCQGANGGPTSVHYTWNGSKTACTITNEGGYVKITALDIYFGTCAVGTYVYVEFAGAEYADDWYEMINKGVSGSNITINLFYGIADDTCDCNVGGAFTPDNDGIDTAMALMAAADEIHIATNSIVSTVHEIAASVTLPATAGGALTPIIIKGVNYLDGSDLSLTDAQPILRASEILANGIIYIDSADTDYYKWENIIIDGNEEAVYCVRTEAVEASFHTWYNCTFKKSTSTTFDNTAPNWNLILCRSEDSGANGFQFNGENCNALYCTIDNPAGHGMSLNADNTFAISCIVNNAGSRGIILADPGACAIGCIVYNSFVHGMRMTTDSNMSIVCNCSCFGHNEVGSYDYAFDGGITQFGFFGFNHANSTTYTNLCTNGNWADFGDGNNVIGDPKCISLIEGSEDFDLEYDSPLQRTGINNTTIGAGSRANPGGGSQVIGGGVVR